MKKRTKVLSLLLLVALTGCDEKQEQAEPTDAKVEAVTAEKSETDAVEEAEPSAEEKAEAEAEAKRQAEEAEAQAEVEANPLTECCRALGQKAFQLRSPEYHGASKACGEAMNEEKEMSAVLPAIKKALKDKALPSECQ